MVGIHRSYFGIFATIHSIIFCIYSVYRRGIGELNLSTRSHTIGGRARDVIHHDSQGDIRHNPPNRGSKPGCALRNSTASTYTMHSGEPFLSVGSSLPMPQQEVEW